MKNSIKYLSLILVLAMLFSVLTVNAYAAESYNSSASQTEKAQDHTNSVMAGYYLITWDIDPTTYAGQAPWYCVIYGTDGSRWQTMLDKPSGALTSPVPVERHYIVPWNIAMFI